MTDRGFAIGRPPVHRHKKRTDGQGQSGPRDVLVRDPVSPPSPRGIRKWPRSPKRPRGPVRTPRQPRNAGLSPDRSPRGWWRSPRSRGSPRRGGRVGAVRSGGRGVCPPYRRTRPPGGGRSPPPRRPPPGRPRLPVKRTSRIIVVSPISSSRISRKAVTKAERTLRPSAASSARK